MRHGSVPTTAKVQHHLLTNPLDGEQSDVKCFFAEETSQWTSSSGKLRLTRLQLHLRLPA